MTLHMIRKNREDKGGVDILWDNGTEGRRGGGVILALLTIASLGDNQS